MERILKSDVVGRCWKLDRLIKYEIKKSESIHSPSDFLIREEEFVVEFCKKTN